MRRSLIFIIGILMLALSTCIDPYVLNLDQYESLLVVEGTVTNAPGPYTIKLTRSSDDQNTDPQMVRNANVSVTDQDQNTHIFIEVSPGIYRSNPALFTGQVGSTYTLKIQTIDGNTYESTPCFLSDVPDIDSIYYLPDNEFFDNGTSEEKGIRLYVNTGENQVNCPYFRWEYEEVWEFRTPYPLGYKFLGGTSVISIPVENETCWKDEKSQKLILQSTLDQETGRVTGQPITFIAPARSDRLNVEYSILVRQYSLSKAEFDFWNNLKEVSEGGGDIFDKQPFTVTGNIHSTTDENEKVLGYFSVSGVKEKRKFISRHVIQEYKLPMYRQSCDVVEIGPIDYVTSGSSYQPSFDDIYQLYTSIGYVFAYPMYQDLSLIRLAFVKPDCSDCSLAGEPQRPDFWIDLP